MSAPRKYTVRVLYRLVGDEKDRMRQVKVIATDESDAKAQARSQVRDSHVDGMQWLGSTAELDDGQMQLL